MRLLLTAALALYACDGGGDDNPDTGSVDSGPGTDGCFDTPPMGDTGVNTAPCNPAVGSGCDLSTGRSCVWEINGDNGTCRCLGDAPHAVGQACTQQNQDCEPGAACLNIGAGATCFKVCTLDEPTECAALSTTDTAFLCYRIIRGDGTQTMNYGLCGGVTRCNPLADACPAAETCTFLGANASGCLASGTVPIGGDCLADNCAKGGVCIPLQDGSGNPLGSKCYQPCDLTAPSCVAGTCSDVMIEGFGICF